MSHLSVIDTGAERVILIIIIKIFNVLGSLGPPTAFGRQTNRTKFQIMRTNQRRKSPERPKISPQSSARPPVAKKKKRNAKTESAKLEISNGGDGWRHQKRRVFFKNFALARRRGKPRTHAHNNNKTYTIDTHTHTRRRARPRAQAAQTQAHTQKQNLAGVGARTTEIFSYFSIFFFFSNFLFLFSPLPRRNGIFLQIDNNETDRTGMPVRGMPRYQTELLNERARRVRGSNGAVHARERAVPQVVRVVRGDDVDDGEPYLISVVGGRDLLHLLLLLQTSQSSPPPPARPSGRTVAPANAFRSETSHGTATSLNRFGPRFL